MTPAGSAIDRFQELGGSLYLVGGRLRYRLPAGDLEARKLLPEIRENRDVIVEMLRDRESQPPPLAEVISKLPDGVSVVRYEPKTVPFVVGAVASVVTNAGKFFRRYLAELPRRLNDPGTRSVPPLADILTKLQDGGLELELEPWLLPGGPR
jgi:hypothetical protein